MNGQLLIYTLLTILVSGAAWTVNRVNGTHAELVRPYFRYVCATSKDANMTGFLRP